MPHGEAVPASEATLDREMTRTDPPSAVPVKALLVLFVLSGAAGLVYEVVWARQLVLVFGNTSQATATILTGFFGGLAVGGALGGRLADRVARPLRLYGLLELVVVVVVLLTPFTFRLIGEAYRGAYPALAENPGGLALLRFAMAVVALAPATLIMGATLPTLTRYLARGPRGLAGAFQRLYTANTIGAIAGTLLAGLVLIETLGMTGALAVGAACSAAAGLVALAIDWRSGGSATGVPEPSAEPAREPAPSGIVPESPGPASRSHRLALTLAFLSGLTSLGYQVTWNRMLAAGTGNSTYVFTVILALFLTGIAIGAGMLGALRLRRSAVIPLIAAAQVTTAIFALLGAVLLRSPSAPFLGSSAVFAPALGLFVATAVFIVLPPTIAMGLTFPATASLLRDDRGTEGEETGLLLAVNTSGSIVATFALPFLVIPLVGSPVTLALLAVTNALVGCVLFARWVPVGRRARTVGAAVGVATAVAVVASLVSGAAFRNPTTTMIAELGGKINAATEDEIAAVVAGELRGRRQLWVGGTSMTVITVDTKLMPLLPLAMRPEAKRCLVIAFGMGTAFRTSLNAGLQTDTVELVPSVPGMFGWFYDDAPAVLANPGGRVIVTDGRNFVELSSQSYDIIVVDPPPPIESSGVSVISSLEFYAAAKQRLTRDGVMVQWVPFGQTQDEFLAHIRTFLEVFPNVRVVRGPGNHGYFMLGSDGPVDLSAEAIAAVLARPGVLADVNAAGDSRGRSAAEWGEYLVAQTLATGDHLRAVVGAGPVITDDRPLPEYFLLRHLANPNARPMTPSGMRALFQ